MRLSNNYLTSSNIVALAKIPEKVSEKIKNYDVIFANGLSDYIKDNLVNNIADFTVPNGNYFMIGDNRNLIHDSRYFALIKRSK